MVPRCVKKGLIMKKISILFVATFLISAASAYAKEYTCTYADSTVKGSGELTVSWDGGKQLDIKGNYSFDEGNDGKLVAQTPVKCSGNRRLPETKANYFKNWAVYDFDLRDHDCAEAS